MKAKNRQDPNFKGSYIVVRMEEGLKTDLQTLANDHQMTVGNYVRSAIKELVRCHKEHRVSEGITMVLPTTKSKH